MKCRQLAVQLLIVGVGTLGAGPARAQNAPAPAPAKETSPDTGDDAWSETAADVSFDDTPELDSTALRLYGFADMNHIVPLWSDESLFSSLLERAENSFFVGNLNIYLVKPISPTLRSMVEVRLLFAPNGADHGGDLDTVRTRYEDVNDFANQHDWGGIQIQRAWVEKDLASYASLRAGYFLTPYGIWNVDHGSPTIIGVRKPYIVGQELFPEFQAGLMLHGHVPIGERRLGYAAYVSNGRGPFQATRDLDEEKAAGGRLSFEGHGFGTWRIGVSGLIDHITDRDDIDSEGFESVQVITLQADERSFAVDLSWDYRRALFRAEAIYNERVFDGARTRFGDGQLDPDYRRGGGYAQIGYRLPWRQVTPYYLFEAYKWGDDPNLDRLTAHSVGINWRPDPELTIKAEYAYATFESPLPVDIGSLSAVMTQLAWVF